MALAARRPLSRLTHLDFALLSIYWIAIGYLWTSLGGLILPDLVVHLVGNAHKGTALGVLEGVGSLMAVVWQPLVGSYSDRTRTRFGRRHPFIFAGTVGDVIFPYQGLLPDVVPDAQRGTASGYYGASNAIGLIAGSVGAGYILAHFGRTAAILSICVLLLATMLPTVLLVPDRAVATKAQFTGLRHAFATTFSRPLRSSPFLWLMASRLLILMGLVGLQSFVLYYFSDVFYHSHVDAAVTAAYTLQGLVIVSALIVALPAARASDRIGRRPLILWGGLLGAAGVLILVFSHYQLLPSSLLEPLARALKVPVLAAQATLVGVLIGIGYGLFFSVDWAFIQDIIPPGEAGLFMGFSNIATAGSGVIARFVGGFLLEFNNGPKVLGLPGGYPVIFTVFFVWLLVGGLLILKVPEMRKT